MKQINLSILVLILFVGHLSAQRDRSNKQKTEFIKKYNPYLAAKNEFPDCKIFCGLNQSKQLVSKPGKSSNFVWDGELSAWNHKTNNDYTYDAESRLAEIIQHNPVSGVNTLRNVIEYTNGIYTLEKFQTWVTDTWIDSLILHNPIDQFGNHTAYIIEERTNGIMDTIIGNRFTNTYIGNNQLSEVITENWNNAWEIITKDTYSYDIAGNQVSAIMQEYSGDNWINSLKFQWFFNPGEIGFNEFKLEQWQEDWVVVNHSYAIEWYDYDNDIISHFIDRQLNGAVWEDFYQETVVFGANGSFVSSSDTLNASGWETVGKETKIFDTLGNFTNDIWDEKIDGIWNTVYENADILTYNTVDITERIKQHTDPSGTDLINFEKYTYSNFQHFNSVPENIKENDINYFSIYNDILKITFQTSKNRKCSMYDIQGRLVIKTISTDNSIEINCMTLQSGVFILKIENESGSVYTHKFVNVK